MELTGRSQVLDPKVLIYTPMGDADTEYSKLEDAGCELTFGNAEWRHAFGASEVNVFPIAHGRDAIIGAVMRGFTFDHDFLSRLTNTRIISKLTIGYDDVDIDAATDLGILVTHSPTEANWGGVAEGTMTMMLTLLKRVREKDRHVRDGGWRDDALAGTFLGARQDGYEGITVGVIGLGRIGSRLCDLLAPWRVNLIAYDPYVDESKFALHNAKAVNLETLLRTSDVITIHSNLTAETEHLISGSQLDQMKPTAILLNAARGPIIDENALFLALDCDRIAGAGLDVFENEPLDLQSPLRGLGDKVLLSPHMVSANKGASLEPAVPWAINAALTAMRGEVPHHVVNEMAIPNFLERFGGQSLVK
ncbi:MAG: Glyoxylate/hydroxypyruvate reductase B [Alphaproteobacteria bacterium MarineAlpha11_Bin1]|nr:MAG: Glyoxylate/hydroxypyruvate reductase B [Alphaproteobacteria bacterium MarineAlpha11_Bin1]|tara:strand:+ start:22918 stop:24006 length:1089 start_codon:yes stop_codon:yes gene_type:complete